MSTIIEEALEDWVLKQKEGESDFAIQIAERATKELKKLPPEKRKEFQEALQEQLLSKKISNGYVNDILNRVKEHFKNEKKTKKKV